MPAWAFDLSGPAAIVAGASRGIGLAIASAPAGAGADEDEVAGRMPLARIGEPGDAGAAAVFLASDGSSWMTGDTPVVDGGQLLRAQSAGVPG